MGLMGLVVFVVAFYYLWDFIDGASKWERENRR
jgi:hypothetical protein